MKGVGKFYYYNNMNEYSIIIMCQNVPTKSFIHKLSKSSPFLWNTSKTVSGNIIYSHLLIHTSYIQRGRNGGGGGGGGGA